MSSFSISHSRPSPLRHSIFPPERPIQTSKKFGRAGVIRYWMFTLSSTLILSCAHQVGPQGGPPDTEPPEIISTYPAPYTLHFDDKRIAIEFSESVEQRSAEESIFISPYVGDLEFDWSGTEVEIRFSENLRINTTYVVNVGTDVKDLRNQNRMSQAFTLAFSTGSQIDRGAIQGRVYSRLQGDDPQGVMVFAYLLEGVNADTVNPRTLKPDYITQTGKGGDFFLKHLAFGAYRVFAVKDQFRNLVYDPEADEFGVPFRDTRITATDTLVANVAMRLGVEDTTKPRLIKVTTENKNHINAEFSEVLDTSTVTASSFFIVDTLAGIELAIRSAFISPFISPSKMSTFTVVTSSQDSTKGYRLIVRSAKDLNGNPVHPSANSLGFTGSGVQDTVGLKLMSSSIKDTSAQAVLAPRISVYLSDATTQDSRVDVAEIVDSLGRRVPASVNWVNDATVEIQPQRNLASAVWHKLKLDIGKLRNWEGIPAKDSLRTIRFETVDAELLSGIEGGVIDRDRMGAGKIIVRAESPGKKEAVVYSTTATTQGSFILSEMKDGQYVLSAFRDANGNGKHDAGLPFPFIESERFTVYPDTLKLRARWPLEGVKLEIK